MSARTDPRRGERGLVLVYVSILGFLMALVWALSWRATHDTIHVERSLVRRAEHDGSASLILAGEQNDPTGIAVDDEAVYWTNRGGGGGQGAIVEPGAVHAEPGGHLAGVPLRRRIPDREDTPDRLPAAYRLCERALSDLCVSIARSCRPAPASTAGWSPVGHGVTGRRARR